MDYINSYVRAKKFFMDQFVSERKEVIKSLKNLKDEIQKETKNQEIGCAACSSLGVLSGGATLLSLLAGPMTAGVSTVLTVAWAGGMASGFVDITHRGLKWSRIRKLVENAVSTLDAHEYTFSNLTQTFLLKLREDIETIKEKIETIKIIKCDEEKEISAILKNLHLIGILINIPENQEKFFNSLGDKDAFIFHLLLSDSLACRGLSLVAKHIAYNGANKIAKEGVKDSATTIAKKGAENGAKQVAKEGMKEGAKDLATNGAKNGAKQVAKEGAKKFANYFSKAFTYASVGVSLGLDLRSLYFSVKDLSKFSAGELCAEAEKLNSVIKKMEYELKYLHKWFEEMSNE